MLCTYFLLYSNICEALFKMKNHVVRAKKCILDAGRLFEVPHGVLEIELPHSWFLD